MAEASTDIKVLFLKDGVEKIDTLYRKFSIMDYIHLFIENKVNELSFLFAALLTPERLYEMLCKSDFTENGVVARESCKLDTDDIVNVKTPLMYSVNQLITSLLYKNQEYALAADPIYATSDLDGDIEKSGFEVCSINTLGSY